MFMSFFLLLATAVPTSAGEISQSKHSLSVNSAVRSGELSKLIERLGSTNLRMQGRAKQRLILVAARSEEERNRVVRELIGVIVAPNVRYEIARSQQEYRIFKAATEILGELRATEALDSLIACLDCSDLVHGESPSRHPVTLAVAHMKEAAVPHLADALADGSVGVRFYAALTLGMIGGTKAKQTLEKALPSERDEYVIGVIKSAIDGISRREKSHFNGLTGGRTKGEAYSNTATSQQ